MNTRTKSCEIDDLILLSLLNRSRLSCKEINMLISHQQINKGIKRHGLYQHLRDLESANLISNTARNKKIKRFALTDKGESKAKKLANYYLKLIKLNE